MGPPTEAAFKLPRDIQTSREAHRYLLRSSRGRLFPCRQCDGMPGTNLSKREQVHAPYAAMSNIAHLNRQEGNALLQSARDLSAAPGALVDDPVALHPE